MNVQGMTTYDEPSEGEKTREEMVQCLACGQVHIVDPSKGPKPPADQE
jgi:hypothetical protein